MKPHDEKFIIEIDYKGNPEDKEIMFEKLKQKIYDDFGCHYFCPEESMQELFKRISVHNPCCFDVIEINSNSLRGKKYV
jgi:hypothetical protein